jgi:hypothetical protein
MRPSDRVHSYPALMCLMPVNRQFQTLSGAGSREA